MVFSFFKKPSQKMVAKPAAVPRPPEATPAVPNAPAEAAPVAAPTSREKPQDVAPAEPEAPSDFSDFQFSESPCDFQIEADVDPIEADVEQAAVLYANAQDEAARALLEEAVHAHQAGPGERLWWMLFDLYRLSGQKAPFEALEIDFARAFEKSPPLWRDRSQGPAAAGRTQSAGSALFKGDLTGDNAAAFAAIRQALAKHPTLRLDLSKVKTFDAAGVDRLLAELSQAHKSKGEIELVGSGHLAALLESRIETGRAVDAEYWLFLLELYQLQGRQEDFEELAINYAVTFEMSPPSWAPKRVAAVAPPPAPVKPATAEPASVNAYVLHGDIKASRFADLPAFAEVHDPVLIDCAGVTRMDFISAGALLNVLSAVRRAGKQVVFRHPNHLVAELFGVVGLKAIAAIILTKN
jgi:anti-anti-sigma regulatory factor